MRVVNNIALFSTLVFIVGDLFDTATTVYGLLAGCVETNPFYASIPFGLQLFLTYLVIDSFMIGVTFVLWLIARLTHYPAWATLIITGWCVILVAVGLSHLRAGVSNWKFVENPYLC